MADAHSTPDVHDAQETQENALFPGSSLSKQVFNLSLPAVGENLLNTMVGLADVFLVGNLSLAAAEHLGYNSVIALNAVGLSNQMVWLMMVLFMAVGWSSTALIARATGAQNAEETQSFLYHAMVVAIGTGVVGMLMLLLLGETFLWLLGTAPEAIPLGVDYLSIVGLASIPASMLFIGMSCMRGAGDTRTPLYIMLGVNVANVLMTWLLVDGNLGLPTLGVSGAAIGTAISRAAGGFLVLWLLFRGHAGLRLKLRQRLDTGITWRLMRLGAPTAGEMFVFHAALLIFTRFVNGLGPAAYAAHIAIIHIESVSFLPGLGYGVAGATLVGQALGAKQPDRAEAYAYEATTQGLLMMGSLGAIIVAIPATLLGFFVNDAATVAVGTVPLLLAGLVQPALAFHFIINGVLRGAGDARWPLYSRLLGTWGVRLPLTVLLVTVLGFGLNAIWLAMCTDFTLQAVLASWRFRSGYWRTLEV